MNRTTQIININSIEQIPSIETIQTIPRERHLKLIFNNKVQNQREAIGQKLKIALPGFLIGIHMIEPEINIAKLITDEEIEIHQDFFEQCAKDYRKLGEELIFKIVEELDLKLNKDFPMETFNGIKLDDRQIGEIKGWRYFVHGFHCGFENNKTEQVIEVPLVFGLEFGDLDPFFFSQFIKSTPDYKPLPVDIFEDYADGVRINKKMISLGKFERITSNVGNHFGIVVADRPKVEIKTYLDLEKMYQEQNKYSERPKFNFWNFIGLKK